MVIQSKILLLAPSGSCKINFFITTLETVVTSGSTMQFPVLAVRAAKKNVFPVCIVKQKGAKSGRVLFLIYMELDWCIDSRICLSGYLHFQQYQWHRTKLG